MRSFLLILFIISTFSLCAQTAPEQLHEVIKRYESRPDKKTEDYWPLQRAAERKSRANLLENLLTDIASLDESQLSETDLINKEMLELIIDDELFHLNFNSHTFPLNAEGGFLAGVVYNIRSTKVDNEEKLELYLEKLKAMSAYFDQQMAFMREGQAAGKSSPRLIVNNCLKLIDHLLNTAPEQTFFTEVSQQEAHQKAIQQVVRTHVFPAYISLKSYLQEEYLSQAPEAIGIAGISDGKAYYEQRVRYYTTFDISPQEVFDTGMAEVKRIRGEMEAIIKELEFDGSFEDFFDFLRTDPQFYATTPQALLDRGAWITTKAQGQLPKFFGLMPRMPLDVVPVPDALAPNYTGGRYSPGSYGIQKSGQFWVNTYNLPSRPLYVLPALALHEGVPGHHLQIMLADELEDLPRFRSNTYLSAFGEGWGLYAEHLGQEMGIYTTLYEQFGRLTYEMWRACRLVVDPGMHYLGWTRQEAFDFMASNTALSLHEVGTEIDRYIGWPGQAVSYKMGELKIKALRKKAEDALRERFDIRDFHDTILKNGSVPMQTLEQIVDRWIENY